MGRLKILIGDEDLAYVESLTGYLMEKYPYKFQVTFFTDLHRFQEFLIGNENKTDIILAGKGFIDLMKKLDYSCTDREHLVISIVEKGDFNRENSLYKYSNGHELVKNITQMYEMFMRADIAEKRQYETRVLAVYSPAGGTGKTAVTINLSRFFSKAGLRVFYLSLETINSSDYFLKTDEESMNNNNSSEEQYSLSKVLFALKQEDDNLNKMIKQATQYDNDYNIGYFLPPDSFLELDELDSSGMKRLLEEIKQSGLFDVILIDLPCSFNYKNIALMEESHEILVIVTPEGIVLNKLTKFLKDIQLHQKIIAAGFLDKMTIIGNRWEEIHSDNPVYETLKHNLSTIGKSVEIKIPDEKIDILQDFAIYNEDSSLNSELKKIVYKYSTMS